MAGKIELNELKKIEFALLCDFADYCARHDLKYYIAYGTLIGAVRHGGFIPWDDDIDVVMPRPDYERLLCLTESEPLREHIAVNTYRRSAGNICPFAKIEDKRTCGQEKDLRCEFKTGVWIDIFPVDGQPSDENEIAKRTAALAPLIKKISLSTRPLVFTPNPLKLVKRIFIRAVYGGVDVKKINKEIESIAMSLPYETSQRVGVTCFGGGIAISLDKAEFEKPVAVRFKGREFPAPSNYHEWMTKLYGDYMTPPPEKDRRFHEFDVFWREDAVLPESSRQKETEPV